MAIDKVVGSVIGKMQTHSLMPYIVDKVHLKRVARQCMRRCSSSGVDGKTWKAYRENLSTNLSLLQNRIIQKTWEPEGYRVVQYPFFTGKELTIVIPTVEDRIVHRAMRNAMTLVLEHNVLKHWVAGYLPKRSRTTAVRQVSNIPTHLKKWIVSIDVASSSQGLSNVQTLALVAPWIKDGSFISLMDKILKSLPSPLAIGSGISPPLLHFRLNEVDQRMSEFNCVRFVDNYCIFCESYTHAVEAYDFATQALSMSMMKPNLQKSWIRDNINPEDLFLIGY